ncbi:hypothetical protein pipiens_008090 [Culex pipiens pipiens]|uniref:Retrotransposon gag domain-containing protein n=1 Tax=Culex pipiens pipiens TaxID=38569 RepID=A0ABD1DIX4_CULPP
MGQPVQEDQARASEEFVAAGASRDQFSERPYPTRQLEQPVTGGETPARVAPDSAMETAGVRWDQFPKFPKDVATTKLWEEWQQFYEDFEMATDVANVRDPYQRCKVLGGQLKAIIKAAGLIPFSNSADCYDTLVKGINEHLFDLTDSEAAHQNFTSMKQAPGESVAAYHARVTVSVKLCKYSEDDCGRFVRTQMINGMANKQLAKEARTHNWTTNYLVQAASRIEALPPAIDENETVMAVASSAPPIMARPRVSNPERMSVSEESASKVKEDARRGARPCRIGPGDTVIVERNVRQKGDTRFDPTRYTVLEERDGNLMLTNDSGNILKRHVSQTKKLFEWRTSAECEAQLSLRPDRARNSSGGNRNSTDEERDPELEPVQRSTREKKKPSYLDQFVRRVDRV